MDNSWKGGFFRFSSWSFKEHFKSQNYLYNTSENEDLWHTCSHLKAWHGRVAVTGAALCGMRGSPADGIQYHIRQGYWSHVLVEDTLLCAQLSPSLTQPLFCIDDISWAFFLCKQHAVSDDAGKCPRHQFFTSWPPETSCVVLGKLQ